MTDIQQLGRYLLMEKISSGGMATVYRAKLFGVEGFVKDVAIKKILPHWSGNREFTHMLVDEAKVLLHLTHANIVQVFELNRADDIYYIVMEYVNGVDLRALSQRLKETGGFLPLPLVFFIARQILAGLHYAHEKKDRTQQSLGIVHRDVSPQNILISYEGEVKITDFGIAKIVGKTSETVTGTLKGKFAYMSPEQALGQKVDHRTDLFAMGILLFEMVTGERCFKGDTDLETLEAVRQARVTFPQISHERIPERLREMMMKALKKNREERFATAADFQADLRAFENEMGFGGGGFQAASGDLKNFLTGLFADRIARQRREEEELSQRTKVYLGKNGEVTRSTPGKTKILVGETRLLKGEDAAKTVVSVVRTVIWDNIRTVIDALPGTMVSVISAVKRKRPLRPFLIVGVVVLAAILFYVGGRPFVRSPAPVSKKRVKEIAQVVKTAATGASPLGAPGSTPIPTGVGFRLLTGYNLPAVPVSASVSVPVSELPAVLKIDAPKTVMYGGVTVGVKPWGKVSIPGVGSGIAEPHFSRKNIPVGDYTVRVTFPPKNKTVSTKISIRENSLVRCNASFGDKPGISCD
ncbi:MAG: serine/threonine protein kinase, partial [Deltaproteobacteria bacterium]|nr:serine/threonine protein kinase [Deltaproteobacteria bacterium]